MPFPQPTNDYMNRAYTGVTGTGDNQLFTQTGTAEPPVSKALVLQGANSYAVGGSGSTQPSSNQPTVSQQTLQKHWQQFMPGVKWPPETGPAWARVVDTQLINSFLQSLRVMDVPGFSDPQTFELTDSQGRVHMYGQAPGSTKVIDLGIKGQGEPGAPEAVDIGGQQYFQQPGADGQFERIPTEKGAGSVPSIEEHGGIKFINQGGQLVPIDNVMKKMKENFVVTGISRVLRRYTSGRPVLLTRNTSTGCSSM